MNTRRNTGRRVGEAGVGGNQAPPQAQTFGVQVLGDPAALTDGQVREELVQMAQAITLRHRLSQPRPLERVLQRRTHMLAP